MNLHQNSIKIRKMQNADVKSVYNLLNGLSSASKAFFHPHPFDIKTILKQQSSKEDHYFVMLLNDKIIGYSFLRLFGYEVPSFGCCIQKEFQHKGYGKIITREAIKIAKKLGYPKILLKVYRKNEIAFNMYKKIGFKIININDKNDEVVMEYKFN